MNITGNMKGKLVNTHRQPRILAHLMKKIANYLETILLLKCAPSFVLSLPSATHKGHIFRGAMPELLETRD